MRGKLQKARLHMNVNYVIKLWEVRVDNVNKTVYKQSYPDERSNVMGVKMQQKSTDCASVKREREK